MGRGKIFDGGWSKQSVWLPLGSAEIGDSSGDVPSLQHWSPTSFLLCTRNQGGLLSDAFCAAALTPKHVRERKLSQLKTPLLPLVSWSCITQVHHYRGTRAQPSHPHSFEPCCIVWTNINAPGLFTHCIGFGKVERGECFSPNRIFHEWHSHFLYYKYKTNNNTHRPEQ